MRRIATLLFCLLFSPSLFAQATNASVTGFVQDSTKAFIPGVTVTAINVGTNAKFTSKTDKSGSYEFPSLPAGPYRMEIEKPGFKTILKEDLDLHVQSALEVNFQMAVGSSSESITVTGDAGNTSNGTVSTVIDRTVIENMPLNGKDLTTLFELSPGTVLNAGGQGEAVGGGFSVDGQRPTANTLTIDGASGDAYIPAVANVAYPNLSGSGISTSASGGTNGILPIDAIEEYRMDTSTYTAENGRTPGGQIQVRTRSGTNQFHGALFENFRNQVLDATDWFVKYNELQQAQLRMNDFGGTLGGPILKNKLFFFVANDNLVLNQPNTSTQGYVPDASIISGAYSVFKAWMAVFPLGNGGQIPGTPSFDYYNMSSPNLIRDHTTSVRIDGQLPKSIHAFFRANVAPSFSVAPSEGGGCCTFLGNGSQVHINTYTGGLNVPLGIHMADELTVNYTGDNTKYINYIPSAGGNSPNALQNNLPAGVNSSTDAFGFFPEATNYGGYDETFIGPQNANQLHQWNIVDTLSWQRGRHALKAGVDFLSRQSIIGRYSNYYDLTVNVSPSAPYTSSDLDTGTISTLSYGTFKDSPIISLSNISLFVNDDWKVTPSLTINAGLRWEYNPPPTVGPLGTLVLQGRSLNPATFQAAVSNQPLYQTRYDNFAPRFGFAWTPHPNSETVIRGGVGIYFDTGQAGATAAANAASSYPYQYSSSYNEISYASVDWGGLAGAATALPESSLYLVDPNLVSPRSYEWSLTVEQQLGKSTKLSTSYVGNDGEKLVGEDHYYNAKNVAGQYPVNIAYVRAGSGNLYYVTNQSHSNYQALQMQLTSRMGQRINALASYTWSHAEDNGSTDFTTVGAAALNPMANSANDIRHIFAASIHYAPVGIMGNRIVRAVTGGWGFDTIARLQTASPITVTVNNNAEDNINSFLTNADVVAGQLTVLHERTDSYSGKAVPGHKVLNWAAFTTPPSSGGVQLRNGDSPTNGYRLFGLTQWDVAASRTWKIWEGLNLNFRVDVYNLPNTANFVISSASWTSANASTFGLAQNTYAGYYGSAASSNGASGAQLATFQNGGPRSLQLSMKLKF